MKKTTIASTIVATLSLAFAPPAALAQHNHGDPHGQKSQHHGTHGGGHSMKMGTSGMNALKQLSGREFDIAFLSQMIPHHQGAIDMSREALPTLKNPQVKKHAQKIIADQTREIRQMTAMLRNDYGVKPAQAHANLMKADMKEMMAMKAQGDRMFLQMMIPHHQGAIDMSEMALRQSSSATVKKLARNIIREQKKEIAEFQRLLHHAS